MLEGVRPVPSEPELRSLFKSFDTDASHTISYEELSSVLEDPPPRSRQESHQVSHESVYREWRSGTDSLLGIAAAVDSLSYPVDELRYPGAKEYDNVGSHIQVVHPRVHLLLHLCSL